MSETTTNREKLQANNVELERLNTIIGNLKQAGLQLDIFKCTKFAVDTFSFQADSATSASIPHSLKTIPKIAIIIASGVTKANCIEKAFFIKGDKGTDGNLTGCFFLPDDNASGLRPYSTANISPASKVTATHFGTVSGTYYYQANVTYTLITMA